MPGKKNARLKKPEMYEDLREEGASKEKAARTPTRPRRKVSPTSVGEAVNRVRMRTGRFQN